jgi:hypothetical protein
VNIYRAAVVIPTLNNDAIFDVVKGVSALGYEEMTDRFRPLESRLEVD